LDLLGDTDADFRQFATTQYAHQTSTESPDESLTPQHDRGDKGEATRKSQNNSPPTSTGVLSDAGLPTDQPQAAPSASSSFRPNNLPYPSNRFFRGRDAETERLHELLTTRRCAVL